MSNKSRYWITAASCTAVTIMNGAVFFTFGVFFKPVSEEFGWSRGEFSACYTAMLLAYAPACYFAGRFSDRRGPRGILLISAALIGLGLFGCSRSGSLPVLILSYAIIGMGVGSTLALPTAIIQRWFIRMRGAMIGVVNSGLGIGGLVFAPTVNHIILNEGWRTAYGTLALIVPVGIGLAALFLEAEPAAKKLRPLGYREAEDGHESRVLLHSPGLRQAFRLGSFRSMTALYILNHIPAFFITAHLVAYATDRGISASVAAQGLGLMSAVNIIGRLVMSWAAGRMGWMKALTVCYVFAFAAVLWLIFISNAGAYYLFVVVYGFFWGSTLSLLGGAVGHFFGLSGLTEMLGFLLAITSLIGAFSPVLAGLSFDLTGDYLSALITACVIFLAAGVLSARLKPPAIARE